MRPGKQIGSENYPFSFDAVMGLPQLLVST